MKQRTFNLKTVKNRDEYRLSLEGDLGIKNALTIRKALSSAEINEENVVLNLNDVQKLDITTIQTLTAFRRHLASKGFEIRINASLPEEVQKLITITGLAGFLNK